MAERHKIFLAYAYPDKKWLDRIQAAVTAASPSLQIVPWDERKLHSGKSWERELPDVLLSCRVAVLLVSDLFLDSDFLRRAKLPARLKTAQEEGLDLGWVLVSHCLHENAGLDDAEALNSLDWPLDGLSTARREAAVASIARKIVALASGKTLPAQADVDDGSTASPDGARLAYIIEARRRTARVLQIFAQWLLPLSLGLLLFAVVAGVFREDLSLLFFIAGFALFVAALRQVVKARLAFIGQSIVTVRCVRTGLADGTLPDRQRGDLLRRARQILGEN